MEPLICQCCNKEASRLLRHWSGWYCPECHERKERTDLDGWKDYDQWKQMQRGADGMTE